MELNEQGQIEVLDHGFVRLVDFMGDDSSIVQAARVSYQQGTKSTSEDAKLIDYLLRMRHTTPFEMVVFKFHAKMPIFCARQWVRHRMASINEVSARYSVLPDEFYIPETLRAQETKNKQGSSGALEDSTDRMYRESIKDHCTAAYHLYQDMLSSGVGREMARMVLPLNIYTEWYWKIDLHNLMHFLRLRLDFHAQWEMQQYAQAIATLIKPVVPMAYKAFKKHIFPGETS